MKGNDMMQNSAHENPRWRRRPTTEASTSRSGSGFIGPLLLLLLIVFVPAGAFAAENVSGEITQDTIWTLDKSPYIVTGDVTVRHLTSSSTGSYFVTLTIEPGVTVRFAPGTGLNIGKNRSGPADVSGYFGALSAQGRADAPITFTSDSDDPDPENWKGVFFTNYTRDSASFLDHCVVEYGGSVDNNNIRIYRSSPTIQNSTFRHSIGHGLVIIHGSPHITSCLIQDNDKSGIFLTGSSNPTIGADAEGNTITTNGEYGVYADDGAPDPVIRFNSITHNGAYPIRIGADMTVSDNITAGNGVDAIEVIGEEITSNTTWSDNGVPTYIVTGDVTVRHTSHSSDGSKVVTLTIAPGVTVRFAPGTGLNIGKNYDLSMSYYGYFGALSAQGRADAPITFTSDSDDPHPENWKGVFFTNYSEDGGTVLTHCIVEYGGHPNQGNLQLFHTSPTIQNTTIRHSATHGIHLTASSPTIENCTISDNGGTGVYAVDGAPDPLIRFNSFTNNGASPIRIGADMRVSDNTAAGNGVDAIQVIPEEITSNTTWSNGIPTYIVNGSVAVRHTSRSSDGSKVVTLTIAPGVTVRFAPGAGLNIGKNYDLAMSYYGYFGALFAQGRADAPITFTSNADVPAPGDWKGVYFTNYTKDGASLLEQCVVEYGGAVNYADVYLYRAKPTIRYSTIRNSAHSGIYVNYPESNGAVITCNNFKDNHHGVYTRNNALPVISNSNFSRNLTSGVYNNGGSAMVKAENNWWGDANGPGHDGDAVHGNVDVDPWLAASSGCIAALPDNDSPFTPRLPTPGDSAAAVPVASGGQPLDLTLSWAGGDPNPWDAVLYDLYFGESEYSLVRLAGGVTDSSRLVAGLAEGRTYFWQVVSRDDMGGETVGPMWRFTTLASDPDNPPPETSKCDGPRSGAGPGNIECE